MERLGKEYIPSKWIYRLSVLLGMFLFAVLLIPSGSKAQEQVSGHVFDDAGYFSEEETEQLEELCLEYGEQSDANIIMMIENGIEGGGWKTFMEDFYDANGPDVFGNCAMLLLDINEKERRIEIQGYGEMEYIITDARIESIIDSIFDDLKAGEYYRALSAFPPLVKQYYDRGYGEDARTHTEEDNENYDPYYYEKKNNSVYFLYCIPAAFIIGGVITAVMVAQSGGKSTTTFYSYMDKDRKSLIGRYDRYTHTTKSQRRKPQENSNHSGGGGGGVSSGGSSHSGGGRSF